jgi:predicted AAA+ superfamily ATPase
MDKDSLFKALGLFIEAIRPYIVLKLTEKAGDKWDNWYYEALSDSQKDNWDLGIKNGTPPVNLIDFHHLKSFAIKYKEILKPNFGKNTSKLPTWLQEIADVRNKCNHFQEVEDRDIRRAFDNMIDIANILKLKELKVEIERLQKGEIVEPKVKEMKTANGLVPWFKNVTPHLDIRQGNLDESVFAANLAEVALGHGREVYQNPSVFFSKTYFTEGLKNIAKRVIKGLNGEEDAENRVITLQTGFGGGKTHALISLYHIAKSGKKIGNLLHTQSLLDYISRPDFDNASIAIFTNRTNDPTQGRKTEEGLTIRTLWGELAYQLAGKAGFEIVRPNDENRTAPKGLFKEVLKKTSNALILIDELADYCVAASGVQVGGSTLSDQTISFIQELSETIASMNKCVVVATLPASVEEVANSEKAAQILKSLSNRLGRVGADTKPVADEEIFEVIRYRLFENIGSTDVINTTVSKYFELYSELKTEVPDYASRSEYKELIKKSYPFHPDLINVFRIKWASNHDFQRTRGVLRLLASIVTDLWRRQDSLTGSNALIHTSDVNFSNLDALSGQLKKLYGNGYDAVITADVSGKSSNAFRIDKSKKELGDYNLAEGLASTILLGSFGSSGANKGTSVQELKLATIKPNSFNHNNIHTALDLLEENAHYLYYSTTGHKRYWFHTKPNINILINQAKGDIKDIDVESEIIRRLKEKDRKIQLFNILVDPSEDIPEQQKPTLIILSPKYQANPDQLNGNTKPIIERIATKRGKGERVYRNTILFLVCSEVTFGKLQADIRDYLACSKISSEYANQLERDQKDDIKRKIEESSKESEGSMVAAYSIVVKYSVKNGFEKLLLKQFKESLDSQINNNIISALKDEEWLLESVGLGILKSNNLLPTKENPIKTKDIYEAFIRFDDKPMITGINAVQNSLQRYCTNGDFCIASGYGKEFTNIFYKEAVPYFEVTNSSYYLLDKSLKPKPVTTEQPKPDGKTPEDGDGLHPVDEPEGEKIGKKEDLIKKFKSITISGKVPVEKYHELFTCFITPFAMSGNKLDIEVKFKIKSNESSPLDETKQQYKSAKEAAKQLGLDFEEE